MKIVHKRTLQKKILEGLSNEDQRYILNREDKMGCDFIEKNIWPLIPECCCNTHIMYSQDGENHISSFYLECKYER